MLKMEVFKARFRKQGWNIWCPRCDKIWYTAQHPLAISAATAHQKWHLSGSVIDDGSDWERYS